jgi:GDPmannose 4,6-dehydratase
MPKVALITGITGQDGAYLSEFLLKKGYIVHGIKRRSSLINTGRIDHLYQDPHVDNKNFILHYGDLSDSTNLIRIIQDVQPDEIYNLGAMSHVRVSFEVPEYVADTDGIGTLRLLEAIRILGLTKKTRIYQASTSELYGLVQETPQKETTPFYPRSPYAVAKLYAYWITVNYREAYNMFACNGILFNHECVSSYIPMIYKKGANGFVNIKPISEIVKYHTNKDKLSIDTANPIYQETTVSENLYVWDKNGWTKVIYASAFPHNVKNDNKQPRMIVAKNAAYMVTGDHVCLMKNEIEKKSKDIQLGDKLSIINYPIVDTENFNLTEKEANLLGFIAGDGYIKESNIQLTSKNQENLEPYRQIWLELNPKNTHHYRQSTSGFNPENKIWQLHLNNAPQWISKFDIYDENRKKCVPFQILNADKAIQLAFLKGYNDADGLKANFCKYEFKNFKTNSATLAAGLIFLLKNTTGQDYNINIETTDKWGVDSMYYSINILSDSDLGQNHRNSVEKQEKVLELVEEGVSQRGIERETGISRTFIRKVQNGYQATDYHHRSKPNDEVKKIIEMPNYDGWFYDLTTESGTFHCGIGQGHVHNSPLRGETFVTRKVTRGVAKIALGMQDKLFMGNLNAKRDWGHAKDFIEGMWLILQQEKPEDFILATGVTTEIREFIRMAFAEVGIELKFKGKGVDEVATIKKCNHPDYQLPIGKEVVAIDPRYFRPTEVDLLLGDPTKAKTKLGWKPKYDVKMLCAEMVAADVELFKREKLLKDAGFEVRNQYE